jgi:arylamine N-acetyltransferase
MAWSDAPVDDERPLTARHTYLSASPDSPFAQVVVVERRDATGVDALRGMILTRRGSDEGTQELTGRAAWFDVLRDLFGLRFDASAPGTADRLWSRTLEAHRSWDAAGRP